jgi:methylthioribose-1-phosphate isomerase
MAKEEKEICRIEEGGKALRVLDQRRLPAEEAYLVLRSSAEVAEAIKTLALRGAPLIGVGAAMGLAVAVANGEDFAEARERIGSARPTAVNLMWAMERMEKVYGAGEGNVEERLHDEAERIREEEWTRCEAIGEHGKALITDGMGVLTHCNAGYLATGHYGTALAPIYAAMEERKRVKVYADETRPLLQGARLTAYELQERGADVTVICDNMAASLMAAGKVGLVLVGCDRVAKNGDVANKIGTLGLAIVAKHYGVPFYVCGPRSTFDGNCPTGNDIIIEQRAGDEVTTRHYERCMAPEGVGVYNPAFDVTPKELITGYITEDGIDKTK